MALDWNKEISFSGLFKRSKSSGSSKYPTKTTMNLYVAESTTQLNRVIPVAIILIIAVILFVKFGVVDQYSRLHDKEAELTQQKLTSAQLETRLSDYDEVLATYQGFAATGDPNAVDAISALDLVTTQVMPYANVSSIVLDDGVLTLTLTGASLSTVGELATHLTGQDMVDSVSVSTAANNMNAQAGDVATITVNLSNGDASTISANNGSTR